ncbi:hypothetical protein HCR_19000 [Hydrogenimonas cancrithermarum]|uniref:Periplasmic protein n=1 Tax=Hydrogenimonas cancrithermarum TaxID=2993563 RepID=A0ABN6WX48_9BACT|nr:hypothetical protein HCR_19000 [Hydrogenimonas cancrithermarum]
MIILAVGLSALHADRIKSTTVACPTVEILEGLEKSDADFKEKNFYIMQQGCVVLTPKDKIHVLSPDASCCGKYLRISIDRTNDIMYVNKYDVFVEQGGTKNILRF